MISLTKRSAQTLTIVLLLAAVMLAGTAPLMAMSPITITVDGQQLALDDNSGQPVIIEDRTYVPLRVISENLGAEVNWVNDTRQVVISTKSDSNSYPVPENLNNGIQIVIDGQALLIPSDYGKAYISKFDRVMIPLRAVGEALGCEVQWISETNQVLIDSKSNDTETPANNNGSTTNPDNELLKDLALFSSNLKLRDGSVINSSQLAGLDASNFSPDQLNDFKVYLGQLSQYPLEIKLPSGETVKLSDISIMGPSTLSAEQLQDWLTSQEPRISAKMAGLGREFIPFPDLAELYIQIGEEYGVRGDIAFFQAVKETNYFQFTGLVTPAQNNYCGLWATGSPLTGQESYNGADPQYVSFQAGLHGASFITPAAGVEAQIQHLYAYATKNPLPAGKVIIDPRFSLVSKGIAPDWVQLNARWAVPGTTYGQSIIYDYWSSAFNK